MKGQDDGENSEENDDDSVMPLEIGPDGVPLRRNPSDVMNNFFIDFVARSFTEIASSGVNF